MTRRSDQGYLPLPDHNYDSFVAQTIAAVKSIEASEQAGISETRRAMLVRYGCTGFNLGRRPPNCDSWCSTTEKERRDAVG